MARTPSAFGILIGTAFAFVIGVTVVGRVRLSQRKAAAPATTAASDAGASSPTTSRVRMSGMKPPEGADMDMPGVGVPPGYRSTNARNYMRMRLRELGVAEENYYNERNSYTTDISQLMLARRTGDVVVLKVTFAGPTGWSAEATHPSLPGMSCVTYAGLATAIPGGIPSTMAQHTQPLGERDLVCDGVSPSS
jgi:hypothetical protein